MFIAPSDLEIFVMSDYVPSYNVNRNYNSYHPNDEEYYNQISQYKDNDELYQMLLNNPWLYEKQPQFTPTFWQGIAEMFGDYSANKRYYADLGSKQQQYVTEAVEKMRQQMYNSEQAQVDRMRAAGLNPDLQGVQPGSAAENDQPLQEPASMDATQGAVFEVGRGALDFVNFILGFGKSLQDLNLGSESLVSQELGNNQSARDFYINLLAGGSKFKAPEDIDASSDADIIAAVKEQDAFEGYSPRTRKYLKKFLSTLKPDSLAVEDLRSRLRSSIAENNKKTASIAGSPIFDENLNKYIGNYAKILGNLEYEAYKLQLLAQSKGWSAEYLDKKLSSTKLKALNELYDTINDFNGGNNWYNTAGILGLPYLGNLFESGSKLLGNINWKRNIFKFAK